MDSKMSRNLTTDFVKSSFEKEGYTILTKTYINNTQELEYICPNGHKGSICWGSWKQGHRCAKCAGIKKLTIEFIREQFEKEGYMLVSDVYVNSKTFLEYICPKGHKGHIKWNVWQRGNRCEDCGGTKKLTIEFIKKEFKKDGYALLTNKYVSAHQKLKYICPKEHKGSIQWCSWKQGHRCFKCRYENNKGKNNPRWNSNLTNEERIIQRNYKEYDDWRFAIYKRYKHICQVCGKYGGIAHHLESYSASFDLRLVLNNGICLCRSCHNRFHHKYGRNNNTKKQFEEFVLNKRISEQNE